MTFDLYDYQKELVNEARKSLATGNEGVLIQSPPRQWEIGCHRRNS